ncbi:MAG: beta-ketoacyl-[acyl-carrier-protein] synthase family protein [Phycisphaerales bacterium]
MKRPDGTHRIVVTGAGWCTPLGDRIEPVWQALMEGRSAMGRVTHFDASTFATDFAAETPAPDLSQRYADASRYGEASAHTKFALAAAADAWKQAGLGDVSKPDGARAPGLSLAPRRVGLYFGFGEGRPDFPSMVASNLAGWDAEKRDTDSVAWAKIALESMTRAGEYEQEPNVAMAHIAEAFEAGGPGFNCMTACAASTQSIGEAFEILREGRADVMLAGGAHTMIHPLGMTGFIRLTAMSTRREDPPAAPRPFDRTRDGFVMGEGAGVVVLETLEHAQRRGATILAEVAGYGSSADAFRITDIEPNGEGAQAAMRGALRQAGIDPETLGADGRPGVHYISAHGTGTKENDSIESKAIKAVFGDRAKQVPVSSIKSMMGHLIQAAGAVEFITCLQAIRTGWLPPTINLNHPDEVCDLDYAPNKARDLSASGGVRAALSNSFGFGGQNNTIIVQRFEG